MMWSAPKYLFKLCCAIATIALITRGLIDFLMDDDASVVETRSFFQTEDDKFPVMSICFEQNFRNELFGQYDKNLTGEDYRKYLLGKYHNEMFQAIYYDSVTTNLSEHIIAYSYTYRNGTHIRGSRDNISWKEPYHTYSWNNWGRFVKCFGIEMTDKDLYHLAIYINRSIFADGLRPQSNGFIVLFHYPNQILSSLHTVMRQWKIRDNNTNYWMEFDVKNVDVIVRRYKKRLDNCIEDWKNYDNIVLMRHLENVKCRSPDQLTNTSFPICSNEIDMRRARLNLKPGGVRPCKEVESINYVMLESEGSPEHLKKYSAEFQSWFHKALNATSPKNTINYEEQQEEHGWFFIVLRMLDPSVKTTINKRAFDFENFVAYSGGFIGLFLGFSLAELPEVLYFTYFYYKRIREKFRTNDSKLEELRASLVQTVNIGAPFKFTAQGSDRDNKKDSEYNKWTKLNDPCEFRKRIDNFEKRLMAIEFFDKTLQKLNE